VPGGGHHATAARATEAGRRSHSPKRDLAPAATNLELAGSGDVPVGWDWSGNRRVHTYRIKLTDERTPSAGRSVRIARTLAPWRWGAGRLEQVVSAEGWRGKRLRFSGAVRAEARDPGSGAQLFIAVRLAPPEGTAWMMPAAAVGMLERPVQSPRWARHAAEIHVPDTAAAIVIGLVLAGNGAGWFGDLELVSF
jgi:hypothetical protein